MSGVPVPVSRFVSLFCGPGYLWLLAVILARVTGYPLYGALLATFLGGFVLVAIFIVVTGRFTDPKQKNSRFSIGTMMLVTTALAIYLAYITQFVEEIRDTPISWYGVVTVLAFSIFFVGVTTLVLMFFADSVVSLLESIVELGRVAKERFGGRPE